MSIKIPLPVVIAILIAAILVPPAFGQLTGNDSLQGHPIDRDEAAILDLLNIYEASFNSRDIEWRLSLCLDTWHEYGFENGHFLQVRNLDETRHDIGRYWASLDNLDYSIDEIEITLDGPQAFVRAYTTHLTRNERHGSIVHFALVKIQGVWRIAWDSYNIVTRFD